MFGRQRFLLYKLKNCHGQVLQDGAAEQALPQTTFSVRTPKIAKIGKK